MRRLPQHYVFILPALIVLVVVVIFPTLFLYYISATNFDLAQGWAARKFVWLDNYRYLFFEDPLFWKSLVITLVFVVSSVTCESVLGMAVALGLNRLGKRLRRVLLSFMIIPMVCTPSIISLIWKLMLNTEYGVINFMIRSLGFSNVNWLGESLALVSVILVDIWEWTPYMVLMLFAALQSVPIEPIEASVVDGASRLQTFLRITLPIIMKLFLIALTLRLVDSFKIFDIIYGLTQGGPGSATEVFSMRIFRIGFQHTNWIGRASAYAVIVLLILSPIFSRFTKLVKKSAY
jgi:multiple sugar transport system permease protein